MSKGEEGGEKGAAGRRRHPVHHCCGVCAACVLTIIVLVLFIVFIVFLVLRPSKPDFYLQNVNVHHLVSVVENPSAVLPNTSTVDAGIQVTLASHNPNERVGIYYDSLAVFTTYRDQPITVPASLPPFYLGHKDVVVWSPVLSAIMVPVAPFIADLLRQDIDAGFVLIHVKVDGRVRWKVGSWVSGEYHLFANCPAMLTAVGGPEPRLDFGQLSQCTVEV